MPEDGCYSASVRLQPPPPEASRLNRRLFGKFTEHLGRNVSEFDQIGGWSRGHDGKGLCEKGLPSWVVGRRDCAPIDVWAGMG